MIRILLVGALLVGAALTGCGGETDAAGSLTVYAAASLRDAFEEIAAAYEEATGVQITISFDASSTLRAQIEQGAPADLFASADLVNAQALVDAGLTDGVTTFAGNALVIVVPADNPARIASWTDLARPGLRIVAAGEGVPITRYAVELIDNLAGRPDAPAGFADAYAANVVSREDNVRAALAKVELGEGDAAIVYETDARSSASAATIAVPDEANVVAAYAVVALADAGPEAERLVGWLLGEDAQRILVDHGFRSPS
ncbi:MAG: molybdate ABC transporter substrate-binding protein [Candidatus Limnocylindria bacterium]